MSRDKTSDTQIALSVTRKRLECGKNISSSPKNMCEGVQLFNLLRKIQAVKIIFCGKCTNSDMDIT